MTAEEAPLDPARPIIDPHLHLWDIRSVPGSPQEPQTFLLPEAVATLAVSGHNVTHTVFVECHAMHRAEGPAEWRSLGETEFANGIAAMSASGAYGATRLAHRIVGNVDLRLGDAAAPVLEAHIAATGDRFIGVRNTTAFAEAGLFGFPCDPALRGVLADPRFRDGARVLARLGLSLDVWCMAPQLPDLVALADAVPDLTIVLDHVGTPDTRGQQVGRAQAAFHQWSGLIAELASRPNARVKLGGMGMDISGPIRATTGQTPSQLLAEQWRPYVETCIAAFGHRRCMFESNFPPDRAAGSYGAVWNAFKRISHGCSEGEKDWLFRRTAADTYRIALDETPAAT